jgi:hypothetical protein
MAESNGPPEEKTVESKPPEVAESAPATVSRPLARDVYDWASRLTAEAGGSEEYYWTPETERLVTKLKMTKRALVGIVGVQGAGKSATMRAIRDQLKNEFPNSTAAVKVPESGGLMDAFRSTYDALYRGQVERLIKQKVVNDFGFDPVFLHRAERLASRIHDLETSVQVGRLRRREIKEWECLSLGICGLVPRRVVHELEDQALQALINAQRLVLIDMPDYPKRDRRLIARDLDDLQGLWNRLMMNNRDVSIVVFIQKETFNHADHFFYGKMDLTDLLPLTSAQLLEAYARKWDGYAPFTEEALQYIAKMSRGIFRRFKRYIGLTIETRIPERAQADVSSAPIGLEVVKKSVTDEEVMRDMDKELDGIFRKREQKEKALELVKHLAASEAFGFYINNATQIVEHAMKQDEVSSRLDISEMAASRLLRELEQHGYIKRFTRPRQMVGGEENIVRLNW